MATVKPLIDYLPQFIKTYAEIKKITDAEQPEITAMTDELDALWNNQFLFDSDDYGVSRWESMLDIVPKSTDALDERKFRIFAKLNQELPYTYTKLIETLTTLCGEDFSVNLSENDYTIEIKLGLANRNNQAEVESILEKMIPANMIKIVTLLYNRHSVLHEFTHGELSAYTHDQLKREVLS